MKPLEIGGIVLCGGRSTRMGRSKAWLPFGSEVMLQRVVGTLVSVIPTIVVVSARDQRLPSLPGPVSIVWDEQEAAGPLGGLAAGFAALRGKVDAVFVCACDVPLLQADVVRRICNSLGENDVAIPVDTRFHHPLTAIYRLSLENRIQELMKVNRLRPTYLLEQAKVRELPVESFRDIDQCLDSFRNINTPQDYVDLLKMAGLEIPDQFTA